MCGGRLAVQAREKGVITEYPGSETCTTTWAVRLRPPAKHPGVV